MPTSSMKTTNWPLRGGGGEGRGQIEMSARAQERAHRQEGSWTHLKQNVPQKSRIMTRTERLWTVELIHRRRCESSMRNVSGTTVLQTACGQKSILRFGNVLSRSVDR